MRPTTAHKTRILMVLTGFLAIAGLSEKSLPRGPLETSHYSHLASTAREQVAHNLGEPPQSLLTPASGDKKPEKNQNSGGSKPTSGTTPPAKGKTDPNSDSPSDSGANSAIWTLVLATYTEGDHAATARDFVSQLRTIAPQIQGARVHTTAKGSMVIYGSYTGRDDPKAETDQQQLKALTYQNRKLFDKVILTRLDLRLTNGPLQPHDLLAARRAHPKVDPLYTLDVAIWIANVDPKTEAKDRLSYEDAKRKAQAYCEKLRAQNFDAWFYNDDENRRAMVTVGLFDRRAINATSGLYNDEVEAMIKKFPVRLVNGEPLLEFKDKFNPKGGTKPQLPKLVLVPMI